VFAFWGIRPRCPAWVAHFYRRRFGIESSYRQLNQARVRTCCRSPLIRLLLVVLALLLRNAWVWLHHKLLGWRRGTGVQLRQELLRFRTLLLLLQRCAEKLLGCAEIADTPIHPNARPPPPIIVR
jgi:IS4 transposase